MSTFTKSTDSLVAAVGLKIIHRDIKLMVRRCAYKGSLLENIDQIMSSLSDERRIQTTHHKAIIRMNKKKSLKTIRVQLSTTFICCTAVRVRLTLNVSDMTDRYFLTLHYIVTKELA